MKIRNLLLFFALFLFTTASSQESKSLYQQIADRYYQHLDKSQIPTGILYDRIAKVAELDTLSDVIHNNTNPAIKTSALHFLQAWQELYDASYNELLKPEWLDALIAEKQMNSIIPIGVLNYRFNVFDEAAMTDNLIYQTSDTLLHDVAGRPRSPYHTKEIFLASPLVQRLKLGNVVFQLPSSMVLQNHSTILSSLSVNLGGGQVITLTPGSSATVQLQQSGTITITLTATFSNGLQKVIYVNIVVEGNGSSAGTSSSSSLSSTSTTSSISTGSRGEPIAPCNSGNIEIIDADIPFADYISGVSKAGRIEAGYYYANCADPIIKKPVIVLDGFDPGDERNLPEEIYDYLYYNNGGTQINLGQELRQAGYDIVTVNFPRIKEGEIYTSFGTIPIIRDGGADYIERNAMALVKLISLLNIRLQQTGSTEKIVIVGPSMGGLISRYALSYMEKNGLNHNCRLWISFDSPHHGANIPIGAQYWLEYYKRVAKKKEAGDALDKQIGSVAAKQMLIHHWLAQSLTPAGAPVFRQQFIQNLESNGSTGSSGFPQTLRKVALVNGSGSGVLQGTACTKVLNMKGFSRNWLRAIPLIGPFIREVATESNIYFSSDYGGVCKVFDGWYSKLIVNNRHYEEKYVQTTSNTRSYDIVPGGYYNTMEYIKSQATISDAVSYTQFSNVVNNHSFIATVSGLALKNPGPNSRDWSENLSTRNLVCSGETPFNAYFTPVYNEEHVLLTSANVTWVKSEINTQPSPSPYPIQIISGYEPICTGTATYGISNLPANSNVSWQVTPTNVVSLSSNTGLQTTASRLANGSATLTANINLCSGQNFVATKTIRAGGFSSGDYPITGPSSASCNQYITFSTNDLPGATYYNWLSWPSSWTYVSGQGTRMLTLSTGSSSGSGQVVLRVANACDAGGSPAVKYVQVNCSGGYLYSVAPNPASSDVTVAVKEEKENKAAKDAVITGIFIYDQQGNLKKYSRYNKVKKANIALNDLGTGIYVIEIINGSYKERQQLSIQK